MYDRVLRQLRESIRTRKYVMTLHAEEEMDNDSLTIFDVERGILSGKIIERQKDTGTGEWKYLVAGKTMSNDRVVVVTQQSPTGTLVIITVYLQ